MDTESCAPGDNSWRCLTSLKLEHCTDILEHPHCISALPPVIITDLSTKNSWSVARIQFHFVIELARYTLISLCTYGIG